jgi:hypothetical protein
VVVVAGPVTFLGGLGPQRSVYHGRVCGEAGDEVTIRQDDGPYGYQLGAMLCFLIFADNLLRRIEGHEEIEEMMWLGVSAGKWELILVSGVLCLLCHLLFWSRIVPAGNPRMRWE